jgi:hypothetical protein
MALQQSRARASIALRELLMMAMESAHLQTVRV